LCQAGHQIVFGHLEVSLGGVQRGFGLGDFGSVPHVEQGLARGHGQLAVGAGAVVAGGAAKSVGGVRQGRLQAIALDGGLQVDGGALERAGLIGLELRSIELRLGSQEGGVVATRRLVQVDEVLGLRTQGARHAQHGQGACPGQRPPRRLCGSVGVR